MKRSVYLLSVFSGNVNVTPATCHCPTNIEDRKEIKKEKKER
jgi:hypothetical protein